MASDNRGKDFLFSSDGGFMNGEDGESYKYSDGSGYYHGADGSEGYIYSDGSGYFHGADGSEGYIYSDGSGYFHGADGSDGYKYSDGSGYYHGADGSDGYRYSDGSGYFNSGDGCSDHFSSETDSLDGDVDSSNSGSWADMLATALGVAVAVGAKKYSQRQVQEREEAAAREAEAEKERLKKEQERKIKNALRKKRIKAFLFKGKKIEIPCDCDEIAHKDISSVTNLFEQSAFSNIIKIPIKDIDDNSSYTEGEVEQVVIDGKMYFKSSDLIPYDTEIIITYHLKKEIAMPYSARSLRNKNYGVVTDELYELGFTQVYVHAIKDLTTGWIKKDGAIESIAIGNPDNRDFKKKSVYPYDIKIYIEYHTFKNKM